MVPAVHVTVIPVGSRVHNGELVGIRLILFHRILAKVGNTVHIERLFLAMNVEGVFVFCLIGHVDTYTVAFSDSDGRTRDGLVKSPPGELLSGIDLELHIIHGKIKDLDLPALIIGYYFVFEDLDRIFPSEDYIVSRQGGVPDEIRLVVGFHLHTPCPH